VCSFNFNRLFTDLIRCPSLFFRIFEISLFKVPMLDRSAFFLGGWFPHAEQNLTPTMPTHVAGEIEAQYAASDRSQCKKCRMNIDKGALRIGEW
jgi:hypothetical protein